MSELNLNPENWPRYVKGLSVVMEMFGVSYITAHAWKKGWLSPAISQQGRTIVVDTAKAIELFKERAK